MTPDSEISATVAEVVNQIIRYGDTNLVAGIQRARPYLMALSSDFTERDVRSVTSQELYAFHQRARSTPAVEPLLEHLEAKSQRWEAAYAPRAQGLIGPLQWESEQPVRALVELFQQRKPDLPKRVLEFGCGDGVNAVFMASQGCEVTAIDISPTALAMAREKQRAAGVEIDFVEGDVFELSLGGRYDMVFDRGMFHHVQVFQFEQYKDLVADQLVLGGCLHLICHHVSARPTVLVDALCGFVGKLLSFIVGTPVEPGAGFTADEVRAIFSDRFHVHEMDVVLDDNGHPFRFLSSVMERTA